MKCITIVTTFTAFTLAAQALRAATPAPGTILNASGSVLGTVNLTSTNIGGCPTRVCTTNEVTFSKCYTNWVWQRVCVTNSAGLVQCTNIPTPVVHCYTNTYPRITCTNEFLGETRSSVTEHLNGVLSASAGCDELFGMFPTNSMFEATLYLSVRTNDWAGTEAGSFRIVAGTNVLAVGSLSGVTGLGSPIAGGPCAACNHFAGTLQGSVLPAGPTPGARITAIYAGDLTDTSCPSPSVPAGAVTLLINGVAVTPCFPHFGFDGDGPKTDVMPAAAQ